MKTTKKLDIDSILALASKRLNSPLEAQLILSFVLGVSRTSLYTRKKEIISLEKYQQFLELIERREEGEPVAYLLGVKEFWSLPFRVTKDVLIPRPETELLIETALRYLPLPESIEAVKKPRILDLGTGSGAIALALAKEYPCAEVFGVDASAEALAIACYNAEYLSLSEVQFYESNWFSYFGSQSMDFDLIIGNPPYISSAEYEQCDIDLRFEPKKALVSELNGLFDLQQIIQDSPKFLKSKGLLILEHAYHQGERVKDLMLNNGFVNIQVFQDLSGLDRVTVGQKQQ